MNREHWKKMLPTIQAFVDGATVKHMGMVVEQVSFTDLCSTYEVVKPKKRVPLEAEDWIKDGPWWVRMAGPDDGISDIVTRVGSTGFGWGNDCWRKHENAGNLVRRNATSDWMPCWKEKE